MGYRIIYPFFSLNGVLDFPVVYCLDFFLFLFSFFYALGMIFFIIAHISGQHMKNFWMERCHDGVQGVIYG